MSNNVISKIKLPDGTSYDLKDNGAVRDVQVNGTSVLSNGVANVPMANGTNPGVVKVQGTGYSRGVILVDNGIVCIDPATSNNIKGAGAVNRPIIPPKQHEAVFYGLAKAAGDTTQAASDNAVGTYTNEAKTAIRAMLGAESAIDYATDLDTQALITGWEVSA